ncbi:MAG: Fic family protein [Clostridia bacterium]|nr:Fic family protein [Clostridia bacterium]
MRDPYLYEDVDVLKNRAGIKDAELLRQAEADITFLSMSMLYSKDYDKYNTETLCDIHRTIFGQIYDWAGEFRTIQMIKPEDVLGGDTVRYAHPRDIKRELNASMTELANLRRDGKNDKDVVFKLVRLIASIWQTHPFREGNTRSIIVFAVLLARHLGYCVDYELFSTNASYVRSALVWCCQGIYSKYQYLEGIFYDAILHIDIENEQIDQSTAGNKYEKIGDYHVKDYVERPHEYEK